MNQGGEAVSALERLGLTEYEARCFVALAQLPHGTARDIGQVADIPRSRVYETMDRLQERGLAEIHQGEPREYQSVPVDTAMETLRNQYDEYFETVEGTLREIEPAYKKATQGVWAINDHEQVTGRISEIVNEATTEIVLIVLDEGLLDETVQVCLGDANDRGVDVYVGTASETVRDHVEGTDVDGRVFTTGLIEWFTAMSDVPRIGRVLMVDREPILVSALHDEELPGVPNETAVWTDGVDHGFATFAKRVITYELRENVPEIEIEAD